MMVRCVEIKLLLWDNGKKSYKIKTNIMGDEIPMDKEHYRKITFDFPADEYVYLKMACAKQGVSMKDFLTRSVIKSIEEYEDELDIIALRKAREENESPILWEEAKKQLGMDNLR